MVQIHWLFQLLLPFFCFRILYTHFVSFLMCPSWAWSDISRTFFASCGCRVLCSCPSGKTQVEFRFYGYVKQGPSLLQVSPSSGRRRRDPVLERLQHALVLNLLLERTKYLRHWCLSRECPCSQGKFLLSLTLPTRCVFRQYLKRAIHTKVSNPLYQIKCTSGCCLYSSSKPPYGALALALTSETPR